MISSEEETSPAKVRAFKAHMKDKAEQEKAKMVQEVADDKRLKERILQKKKRTMRVREKAPNSSDSLSRWNEVRNLAQ